MTTEHSNTASELMLFLNRLPLDDRGILGEMLLDFFIARKRALGLEMTEVNAMLEQLRAGHLSRAERGQRIEERKKL